MPWTDYSSAPPLGTVVCAEEQVSTVLSLKVETERGIFPMLILRADGELRAYVNACPHQYLPLDYRSDNLLSADGSKLMCSAHGAMFDLVTGEALCVAPTGLDPVPICLKDGMVIIGSQ